jgi:hypothetical protein
MGLVSDEGKVVTLETVAKVERPAGSGSKTALNKATPSGSQGSLGYSIFMPGTVLTAIAHEVEELTMVIARRGELRLNNREIT